MIVKRPVSSPRRHPLAVPLTDGTSKKSAMPGGRQSARRENTCRTLIAVGTPLMALNVAQMRDGGSEYLGTHAASRYRVCLPF
jgi:hypothetical protein